MKVSRAHRVRKLLAHRARDGYVTAMGYMGFVEGRYILFSSESDYVDYVREMTETPAEAA